MSYMTKLTASKIMEEFLDTLYRNSTPPITWNEVKEKYEGKKLEFYRFHKIEKQLYEDIYNEYSRKLTPMWRKQLAWVSLDYSPTFK